MGESKILPASYGVAPRLFNINASRQMLDSGELLTTFLRFGGDFLAGLTVASILIPQSISYASSLAKLSPLAGLVSGLFSIPISFCGIYTSYKYSAAIPGIVYALLGTSRQLNVAPEAALSLLIGQAVSAVLHDDPHAHPTNPDAVAIAVTTITTLQVGLFSFFLGLLRLGFMDVLLSRALLRGFVSAIAVVIMMWDPPSSHSSRVLLTVILVNS